MKIWSRGRVLAVLISAVSLAVVSGLGCESATIENGMVIPVDDINGFANTYAGDTNLVNAYVEYTVQSVPTSAMYVVTMRHTSPGNSYLCAIGDAGGGTLGTMIEDAKDNFTTDRFIDFGTPIASVQPFVFGCGIGPDEVIRAYKDGVEILSYTIGNDPTDPVISNGGSWGFGITGTAGTAIDDFRLYHEKPSN